MEQLEIMRNVSKWGNSAGILVPREWLGNRVKVILIERTLEIKKEVLEIISSYLEDILGVYLTGSYARGEQEKSSDVDIIAVSKNINKEIVSGKYHLSIITLENIRKTLEKSPILVLPRLIEAKPILNSYLLEELKNIKVSKNSFKNYVKETERIISINEGLLKLEKEEFLESNEITYSLILRLRGIFIINNLLKNKNYSKKEFMKYLSRIIKKEEIEKVYNIYQSIRDNKKTHIRIKTKTAKNLLNFLKKEVKHI